MSVPSGPPDQTPSDEHTVSVDLTAFLPEGVELVASEDASADEAMATGALVPVIHEMATAAEALAGIDPAAAVSPTPWRPDLDALDGVEADLDAVDASLQALDDGTYGTCRVCAQRIDDDLLAASPTRTTCAIHA